MRKLILPFILLYSLSVYLNAQTNGNEKWDLHIKLEKPIAKLDKATGWFHDVENDNWISGQNEIVDLDNFDKLEFGVGLIDGHKYLYLRKTHEYIFHYHDESNHDKRWSDKHKDSYLCVLDLDQYKEEVLKMTDFYNVLYLDILAKEDVYADGMNIFSFNFSESPYYTLVRNQKIKAYEEAIEEAERLRYDWEVEGLEKELEDAKIPFRDKHKLIIKSVTDENREKVQFFIFYANTYYENKWNERYIPQVNIFQSKNVYDAIEITDDVMDIMWSDNLFEYFHYETEYDKFMDFIQAPLKLSAEDGKSEESAD